MTTQTNTPIATNESSEQTFEVKRVPIEICVKPDEDHGYVGFAPRLPGVVSQGETIDETFHNLKEALAQVLESYKDAGEDIPLLNHENATSPIDDDVQSAWEFVDLGDA